MTLWVFDLDGTLVDTSGDIAHAANVVLGELGVASKPESEIMAQVGRGTTWLWSSLLARHHDDPWVDIAEKRFVEVYSRDPVGRSRPYPGVPETLRTLARSASLAVVSNKSLTLVRATLEGIGMSRLIAHACGGGTGLKLKPAPDGILEAMTATGATPQDTTMLGDMPLDVDAGRAAGVRTLFARWGYGTLGPADTQPDGSLESFPEVLEWNV